MLNALIQTVVQTWELASLLRDPQAQISAALVSARAYLICGHNSLAICQAQRALRIARGPIGNDHVRISALILAAKAWQSQGNTGASEHLTDLARTLVDTQIDAKVRTRLEALFYAETLFSQHDRHPPTALPRKPTLSRLDTPFFIARKP